MVELRDVSFSYDAEKNVLEHVSFGLRPGEHVVLLGRNGSGKSTLGRLLNGSLRPSSGTVLLDGVDVTGAPRGVLARAAGYVRQDPLAQIVSDLGFDEVAFGPRNLGLSPAEVRERVEEALAACGIAPLARRLTSELSGGQQQLLALAGALAMRPAHLVLDEADAHLDQATRTRLRAVVRTAVARGAGVLEIAHSGEALPDATRVIVLSAGRLAWEGSPEALLRDPAALAASGLESDPVAAALARAVASGHGLAQAASPEVLGRFAEKDVPLAAVSRPARERLVARDVAVSYGDVEALRGASLGAGGLTLLLGASGSGKTTLARVLAGVLDPDAGEASLDGARVRPGTVGLSFQRPEDQLFCETVLDDVAYGPRARGAGEDEARELARSVATRLGVDEELLGRSPFSLSGGQMRRVALAGVMAVRPAAYVFDEPSAGLDAPGRAELAHTVRGIADEGAAVVVITHDAGEWLDVADGVAFMREGRVTARASAREARRSPELFEAAGLEAPLLVRARSAREVSPRA